MESQVLDCTMEYFIKNAEVTYHDKECGGHSDFIRRIIKDIDEDFDVFFTYDTETYTITHKGRVFSFVKHGELSREFFDDMRRTVWLNRRNEVLKEIEKNNEKFLAKQEKAQTDRNEQMAKDMLWAMRKDNLI